MIGVSVALLLVAFVLTHFSDVNTRKARPWLNVVISWLFILAIVSFILAALSK